MEAAPAPTAESAGPSGPTATPCQQFAGLGAEIGCRRHFAGTHPTSPTPKMVSLGSLVTSEPPQVVSAPPDPHVGL